MFDLKSHRPCASLSKYVSTKNVFENVKELALCVTSRIFIV